MIQTSFPLLYLIIKKPTTIEDTKKKDKSGLGKMKHA